MMIQKTKNRKAILWKFNNKDSMRVEIKDLGNIVYLKAEQTIKESGAEHIKIFELEYKLSFDILMEDLICQGFSLANYRNI